MVKSTRCSSRACRSNSQHPYGSSQPSKTLVLGELMPSSGLQGHCMHMAHIHAIKTSVHRNKNLYVKYTHSFFPPSSTQPSIWEVWPFVCEVHINWFVKFSLPSFVMFSQPPTVRLSWFVTDLHLPANLGTYSVFTDVGDRIASTARGFAGS